MCKYIYYLQVVVPRRFALVCFRLLPPTHKDEDCSNQLNRNLLDFVNATGEAFVSHTVCFLVQ